jgi:hypothetical protein
MVDTGTPCIGTAFSPGKTRRNKMTQLRTVSAALLLSAAIATPALAQEIIVSPRYAVEVQPGPTYYQGYDEYDAPLVVPSRYYDRYGHHFGYRDHSRPGGYSPSRNPAAN